MYRMCRPAGAADPRCPSLLVFHPALATSWHPERQHRRCSSTPSSSLLSQRTPTPPSLSVHSVLHLPAGHAQGFCNATVGRAVSRVSRASLLASWGSQQPSLGICCWPPAEVNPELDGQGLNQPKVTAVSPILAAAGRRQSSKTCSSHSSSVRKSIIRLGGTRLTLILIITCVHWPGMGGSGSGIELRDR